MGIFSWTCAHCEHSILVHCDEGINDWMQRAVVLSSAGEVYRGAYDGYGDAGELVNEMYQGAVMVHEACWEVAGKPEFGHYREHGLASESAEDQGYFFDEEHDVIDPRVTDEAERERRLRAGRELREQRRFDGMAQEVGLLVHDPRFGKDSWHLFFSLLAPIGKWTTYRMVDKFHRSTRTDATTKEEAEQFAQRAWSNWLDSEEFAQLKARFLELARAAHDRWIEELKGLGRYVVNFRSVQGDTILREGEQAWMGSRTIFYVTDKATHVQVAVMDGPDREFGRKTFTFDVPSNQSPEWKARMEGMWASHRESKRLATEEAARLNAEWAAAGYPVEALSWSPRTEREDVRDDAYGEPSLQETAP